jgi:DNA invertase Pin-like site-specific DNA recombinase
MPIDYVRVSTLVQTLNLKMDSLKQVKCSKIFTDSASGANTERKGLDEALKFLRLHDTLVVV